MIQKEKKKKKKKERERNLRRKLEIYNDCTDREILRSDDRLAGKEVNKQGKKKKKN